VEQTAPALDIHGLPVIIRRRRGKKGVTLRIKADMKIYASAGFSVSDSQIYAFAKQKQDWVKKHKLDLEERAKYRPKEGLFYFLGELVTLKGHKDEIYLSRGKDFLPKRLADHCETFPLKPKSVTVKLLRSRWGSCTDRGTISLNARLMAAPLWVIDSVIIHELCHLRHLNHSNAFWQMLEKYSPLCDEAQEWLKKHLHQE